MTLDSLFRFRPGMFVLAALFAGCAATSAPTEDEEMMDELEGGQQDAPIIGGSKATAYPEAALLNFAGSACSGALITPKVVLTAGHCIVSGAYSVTLPFANGQKAGGKGYVYDYNSNSQYVDPNTHDVGLVVLDKALSIASYPLVANKGVPDGTKVQNIGRINNGQFSDSALFISQPLAVKDAKSAGFPFDYIATEVIQPGDSGGPVVVAGTHNIVAVNSGAGGGTQVLARVELVQTWIKQIVDQNGGGVKFGDPLGGGGDVPPEGPQNPPSDPPSGGATEAEPNNVYNQNNPLGASMKGELTVGDQDWFTWEVGASGVKYDLKVAATGDAQVQMWKLVNGQYYKTPQQTPTSISQTSTGPGTYFVVVHSKSSSAQSYTVTLKK